MPQTYAAASDARLASCESQQCCAALAPVCRFPLAARPAHCFGGSALAPNWPSGSGSAGRKPGKGARRPRVNSTVRPRARSASCGLRVPITRPRALRSRCSPLGQARASWAIGRAKRLNLKCFQRARATPSAHSGWPSKEPSLAEARGKRGRDCSQGYRRAKPAESLHEAARGERGLGGRRRRCGSETRAAGVRQAAAGGGKLIIQRKQSGAGTRRGGVRFIDILGRAHIQIAPLP